MADDPSETEMLLGCEGAKERQKLLADLFMRHRKRLRRMIELRLDTRVKRRIGPSDVIQEAFLEASQRLDTYLRKPEVSVFLWLRFLTGQKLQELHRRHLGAKMRDARREEALHRGAMPQATSQALAVLLVGRGTSPGDAAIRAERRVRLQEALDSMDRDDREVLALRHFELLSNAEVAQLLQINKPAAKMRYLRALKRLREVLKRMPGGAEDDWL